MNHAFIDASWQEQLNGEGLGGWGLVLIQPGMLPMQFQGQLEAPDNNAAELRAVLEALRAAPAGERLTVHTDNQAVIACVSRGRGPHLLAELTRQVLDESMARKITMQVRYIQRTQRHMLGAHQLANDARKGIVSDTKTTLTDVLLEHKVAHTEARISVRRSSERMTAFVHLDPLSDIPPSTQILLAAVHMARPGEQLMVRRASKIAQAMWQKPERALRGKAHMALQHSRQRADRMGVQVQFSP